MKKLILILLLTVYCTGNSQGFLHRDGQNIVDGNGQNVLLRGLGLGGWMVQEGYMLQTDAFVGPQHKIREKITALIGAANTETFYQAYRDNGITKRDIDSLKAWGFNSVRLPMHYNLYTPPIELETGGQNTWLTEGFERTDALLEWCAQNEMYLILDLHAAPGGQGKDANISDYDSTKPSLWESEANRTKMVALWRQLAERYKDHPWIGAYDIINEPNWAFTGSNQNGCDETSNAPLRSLMVQVTNAIREVDNNHMIIIEGNCWGNNYNGIFPLWDNNIAVSFHKYWNYNTQASIQTMLNYRTQYNVPIWLGESGENSNVWFRDAISLMESNNIGWAFWPMKKIENIAGVTSITKTPEYQALLNHWQNGAAAPSAATAFATLMQIAENYKMANANVKYDVIDAMFRQIQTTETIRFKPHPLPGTIFATEFDLGTNGHAYWDTDVANYKVDTGVFADWNKGWSMRNDGVDISSCNDVVNNGFQVGFIAANEWLQFTLNTTSQTAYDVDFRYAGTGGKIYLEDSQGRISETLTLPNSGGTTVWQTASLTDILLEAGTNKVKVYFENGGFNLNFLEFKNPRPSSQAVFKIIDASTNVLGDKINLVFNKDLQPGINLSLSQLSIKVNGNLTAISNSQISATSANTIILTPATPINPGNSVTASYAGTNIIAADATSTVSFVDKIVVNRVGNILGISGKIEAEDFYANNGLSTETTSDVNGGLNIGFTDSGDALDYLVDIAQEGSYRIEYRTAGLNTAGSVTLQLINASTTTVHTVSLPSTGGWQTWNTIVTESALPQGRYILKLLIQNGGFNLNWVKFSYLVPDDDNDNVGNDTDLCANTPAGDVVGFDGCTLFSLATNNFSISTTSETCRSANNGSISINAVADHGYVGTLTGNGVNVSNAFNDSTAFDGLAAGLYNFCVTLLEAPLFQRCYELNITEPEDLSVFSRLSEDAFKIKLTLAGGVTYTIVLNGIIYSTQETEVLLDLKSGINDLMVKTEKDCQGIITEKIIIDDKVIVYPNPVKSDKLLVSVPVQKNEQIRLEVFSMLGKSVITTNLQTENQTVALDLTALSAGTYGLKVTTKNNTYNTKIIRQ